MKLSPYQLVITENEWSDCLTILQQEPRLAIDLEANSLYAYRERVCLIQISTSSQDYIVDPTNDLDLTGLGELIGDPEVEKVFHAAEYDLILLKRQYGWRLENLFDTMWAARILGYSRCGLASLLEQYYGIEVNKKHQKANWCRRPLNQNLLRYAQTDTHYLFGLRDQLEQELVAAGRMAEAQETFADQCQVTGNTNHFDPDDFWNIYGVRELSPQQWAIAKTLFVFRDQQARRFDRPPFKIFDDRTLVEIAGAEPRFMEELPQIHGMSKGQIRRYGRRILDLVAKGQREPTPSKPKVYSQRPPDEVANRYEKLRNWRKQKAQARGVESDVILSRDALWALAWANPHNPSELVQIKELGPWRRSTYGEEILRVLHSRHTAGS